MLFLWFIFLWTQANILNENKYELSRYPCIITIHFLHIVWHGIFQNKKKNKKCHNFMPFFTWFHSREKKKLSCHILCLITCFTWDYKRQSLILLNIDATEKNIETQMKINKKRFHARKNMSFSFFHFRWTRTKSKRKKKCFSINV